MSEQVTNQPHIASVKMYTLGFILALALTFAAFLVAGQKLLDGNGLLVYLLVLAVVQTFIQLWFFLHIGREEKPRWNVIFLLNTIGIILLIVVASIWIMNSLHYRMMSPEEMEQYAIEESTKGF